MSERVNPNYLCGLVLLAMVAQVGCQSMGTKPLAAVTEMTLPWEGEKEPRKGPPDRLVGTWTEAVRHNAEIGGERGFGGRLFFYDRNGSEPIRVEGQLVVYAFVENDRLTTDHRPTRRYVFPPEQLAKHESISDLGVSYSFWLPWDRVGGEQADVSLIARFEPLQGGGLVVGDQTRHRLPGPARTSIAKATPPAGQVQPAVAHESPQQKVMQTALTSETANPAENAVTITLPRGFERHLSGNQAAPAQRPLREAPQPSSTAPAPVATPQAPVPASAASLIDQAMGGFPSPPTEENLLRAEIPHYQPGPMKTSVTLLSPGESVRRSLQPRSFGYQPPTPPAQATLTSPSTTVR